MCVCMNECMCICTYIYVYAYKYMFIFWVENTTGVLYPERVKFTNSMTSDKDSYYTSVTFLCSYSF